MAKSLHNSVRMTDSARYAPFRRKGSVLVLVMTVLGVLFVTGIAFLATMNFEAEMITAEREREQTRPEVEDVTDTDMALLRNLSPPTKVLEDVDEAPLLASELGTDALPVLGDVDFAGIPGLFNLAAPLEPYWKDLRYNNGDDQERLAFAWFTNVEALNGQYHNWEQNDPVLDYYLAEIDTQWLSGVDPDFSEVDKWFSDNYPRLTPVDADGDGIVDAMQVGLQWLDVDPARYQSLAKVLNPKSNPNGGVYLAMRVIAHGGMINLTYGHPELIRQIYLLDDDNDNDNDAPPQQSDEYVPYSPVAEEPWLRRRGGMLPPRNLPPTQIQGNPWSTDIDKYDGDFHAELFLPGETAVAHRYWPYGPEEVAPSVDRDAPIWQARMSPDRTRPPWSQTDDELRQYDLRHLVTTISHDDLLRRATPIVSTDAIPKITDERPDVLELMNEANSQYRIENNWTGACEGFLPFEFANYPQTLEHTYTREIDQDELVPGEDYPDYRRDWCRCDRAGLDDGSCTFHPLKGRLRLSLPWLNEEFDIGIDAEKEEAIRIIQDAFTLMLLNARGSDWGVHVPVDGDLDGNPDWPVDKDGDGFDARDWVRRVWQPNLYADVGPNMASIELAAASLTANLIDFADYEDDDNNNVNDDIPTRVELRSADFRDLDKFGRGFEPPVYVYGIERQPFITEVVAYFKDEDPPPSGDGVPEPGSYFGVELFNPYQDYVDSDGKQVKGAIELRDYSLRIKGMRFPLKDARPFQQFILPDRFIGYFDGIRPPNSDIANTRQLQGLQFQDDTTIELIRNLLDGTEVVVDQFEIPAGGVGMPNTGPPNMERVVKNIDVSRWHAPLPYYIMPVNHMFGGPSSQLTLNQPPVEVKLANNGSLPNAFPTTGSLLLLMRHANSESRAFTSYLDVENFPIDNGRMPVFDLEGRYHENPAEDPTILVDASGKLLSTQGRPGSLIHLPWGQLVFDYFTALPLENDGPFGEYSADLYGANPIQAQWPRVDLDGLRVHGRIDLNAAPWSVMSGLPYIPMAKIPLPFRGTFREVLGLDSDDDNKATRLKEPLAKAIVAYREQRRLDWRDASNHDFTTGNYGERCAEGTCQPDADGRAWNLDTPSTRRGMGFMTVGELANVRHRSADPVVTRFDSGEIFYLPDAGYLKAIAILASLGDWVTVRSQVFTVYGTLRGDFDPVIVEALTNGGAGSLKAEDGPILTEDVDSRALRFQETLDRLPTLLGAEAPTRVGDRVLANYHDIRND